MAAAGVVFVIILLSASALAQTCVPVETLLPSVPFCAPFVQLGTQIYTDATTANLTNVLYTGIRNFGHYERVNFVGANRNCFNVAARLLCSWFLRPCVTLPGSSTPAYRQPCSNVCTEFRTAPACQPHRYANCSANNGTSGSISLPSCATLLINGIRNDPYAIPVTVSNISSPATVAALYPPCDALNVGGGLDGQSQYGDATWVAGGSSSVVTCSAPALVDQNSTTFPCYTPYRSMPWAPPLDGYCSTICPLQFLPRQAQINYWANILAMPCVLAAMLCFGLRTLKVKYCRFPTNLILWLCWGIFIFNFPLMIEIFTPTQSCIDDQVSSIDPTYPVSRLCGAQAVMFFIGYLTYILAWCGIAICSAIVVILKREPWAKVRWLSYVVYAFIFFVPILFAAVQSYDGFRGQFSSQAYCWVNANNNNKNWGLFFAPIGLCIFACTGAIGIVVFQMARATDSVSPWHIKNNIRLLVFLIFGMLGALMMFSFRVNTEVGNSRTQVAVPPLLMQYRLTDTRGDQQMGSVTQAYLGAYIILNHLCPIIMCLVFVLSPDLWTLENMQSPHVGLLTCLQLRSDDSHSTGTTAGSSSSGSSSAEESTFMSDLS